LGIYFYNCFADVHTEVHDGENYVQGTVDDCEDFAIGISGNSIVMTAEPENNFCRQV